MNQFHLGFNGMIEPCANLEHCIFRDGGHYDTPESAVAARNMAAMKGALIMLPVVEYSR